MPLVISEVLDPSLSRALQRLQADLEASTNNVQYERQKVTFPTTANEDMVIATKLRPTNPEAIGWVIEGYEFFSAPATTPCIYKDTSATRHPWATGFIVLRCNIASVTVNLLLGIKR